MRLERRALPMCDGREVHADEITLVTKDTVRHASAVNRRVPRDFTDRDCRTGWNGLFHLDAGAFVRNILQYAIEITRTPFDPHEVGTKEPALHTPFVHALLSAEKGPPIRVELCGNRAPTVVQHSFDGLAERGDAEHRAEGWDLCPLTALCKAAAHHF